MSPYMDRIVERLRHAEDDLRRDVEAQQQRWHYTVHRRRVRFDHELRDAHRRLKLGIAAYIRHGSVFSLLTAPLIYSLLLPLALLDLWVTLYQWICLPIYGVARVSRKPLPDRRPSQAGIPQRPRKDALHLLQLRQRRHRLYA